MQAHVALGKLNEAVLAAKEAVTIAPKSASAYYLLGSVLMRSKEGQKEVHHNLINIIIRFFL